MKALKMMRRKSSFSEAEAKRQQQEEIRSSTSIGGMTTSTSASSISPPLPTTGTRKGILNSIATAPKPVMLPSQPQSALPPPQSPPQLSPQSTVTTPQSILNVRPFSGFDFGSLVDDAGKAAADAADGKPAAQNGAPQPSTPPMQQRPQQQPARVPQATPPAVAPKHPLVSTPQTPQTLAQQQQGRKPSAASSPHTPLSAGSVPDRSPSPNTTRRIKRIPSPSSSALPDQPGIFRTLEQGEAAIPPRAASPFRPPVQMTPGAHVMATPPPQQQQRQLPLQQQQRPPPAAPHAAMMAPPTAPHAAMMAQPAALSAAPRAALMSPPSPAPSFHTALDVLPPSNANSRAASPVAMRNALTDEALLASSTSATLASAAPIRAAPASPARSAAYLAPAPGGYGQHLSAASSAASLASVTDSRDVRAPSPSPGKEKKSRRLSFSFKKSKAPAAGEAPPMPIAGGSNGLEFPSRAPSPLPDRSPSPLPGEKEKDKEKRTRRFSFKRNKSPQPAAEAPPMPNDPFMGAPPSRSASPMPGARSASPAPGARSASPLPNRAPSPFAPRSPLPLPGRSASPLPGRSASPLPGGEADEARASGKLNSRKSFIRLGGSKKPSKQELAEEQIRMMEAKQAAADREVADAQAAIAAARAEEAERMAKAAAALRERERAQQAALAQRLNHEAWERERQATAAKATEEREAKSRAGNADVSARTDARADALARELELLDAAHGSRTPPTPSSPSKTRSRRSSTHSSKRYSVAAASVPRNIDFELNPTSPTLPLSPAFASGGATHTFPFPSATAAAVDADEQLQRSMAEAEASRLAAQAEEQRLAALAEEQKNAEKEAKREEKRKAAEQAALEREEAVTAQRVRDEADREARAVAAAQAQDVQARGMAAAAAAREERARLELEKALFTQELQRQENAKRMSHAQRFSLIAVQRDAAQADYSRMPSSPVAYGGDFPRVPTPSRRASQAQIDEREQAMHAIHQGLGSLGQNAEQQQRVPTEQAIKRFSVALAPRPKSVDVDTLLAQSKGSFAVAAHQGPGWACHGVVDEKLAQQLAQKHRNVQRVVVTRPRRAEGQAPPGSSGSARSSDTDSFATVDIKTKTAGVTEVAESQADGEVEEVLKEYTYSRLGELIWTRASPDMLLQLIHGLDIADVKAMRQVSSSIRVALDQLAGREVVLRQFLAPFGYRTWVVPRRQGEPEQLDPLPLTLTDAEAFLVSYDLVGEYKVVGRQCARDPNSLDPQIPRLARATTRAYNRVLARLRLQPTFSIPAPPRNAAPPSPSTPATPPNLTASPTSPKTPGMLPSGSPLASPALDAAPERVSPWKPGRAAHWRVWVPCADPAGWMSDEELAKCEAQLFESGVWERALRRGDVVWNTAIGDERNEGKHIFDGQYLRDLSFAFDPVGHLPSWLNSLLFPPSYFHNVLRSSTAQPVIYLDVLPWREALLGSLRLVQDHVETVSPQGRYKVAKWLYRAVVSVTAGQLVGTEGIEAVDGGWHGKLVIETEGTSEHAKALVARCAGPAASPAAKAALLASVMDPANRETSFEPPSGEDASGTKVETTSPWVVMRERSRPGLIWLKPV